MYFWSMRDPHMIVIITQTWGEEWYYIAIIFHGYSTYLSSKLTEKVRVYALLLFYTHIKFPPITIGHIYTAFIASFTTQ